MKPESITSFPICTSHKTVSSTHNILKIGYVLTLFGLLTVVLICSKFKYYSNQSCICFKDTANGGILKAVFYRSKAVLLSSFFHFSCSHSLHWKNTSFAVIAVTTVNALASSRFWPASWYERTFRFPLRSLSRTSVSTCSEHLQKASNDGRNRVKPP